MKIRQAIAGQFQVLSSSITLFIMKLLYQIIKLLYTGLESSRRSPRLRRVGAQDPLSAIQRLADLVTHSRSDLRRTRDSKLAVSMSEHLLTVAHQGHRAHHWTTEAEGQTLFHSRAHLSDGATISMNFTPVQLGSLLTIPHQSFVVFNHLPFLFDYRDIISNNQIIVHRFIVCQKRYKKVGTRLARVWREKIFWRNFCRESY